MLGPPPCAMHLKNYFSFSPQNASSSFKMTTEADEPSLEQKFTRILCVLFKATTCILICPIYNGQMFREEKHLKDPEKDSIKDTQNMPAPYQAVGFGSGSYTKTNKLITALYMVTDIIDKDEPLRNKLRTLGTEIISDMNSTPASARGKIKETVSFLDIASAINIISEMNCSILKKEFLELNESINEAVGGSKEISKQINLAEFFDASVLDEEGANSGLKSSLSFKQIYLDKGQKNSKGHLSTQAGTSIGVQKGSTLMKALSKVNISARPATESFDALKKQRREEISNIVRKMGGGATITDIKNGAYGSLVSCGEKTLQRELVSMIKDTILSKTGEKRWSRYFLK